MMSASSQMKVAAAKEAHVYALVERAAIEGRRCPTNAEIADDLNKSGLIKPVAAASIPGVFRKLIQRRLVTVRIYGHNWRDVVIIKGPHAGKTTLPPPHGGKPYRILSSTSMSGRRTTKPLAGEKKRT